MKNNGKRNKPIGFFGHWAKYLIEKYGSEVEDDDEKGSDEYAKYDLGTYKDDEVEKDKS